MTCFVGLALANCFLKVAFGRERWKGIQREACRRSPRVTTCDEMHIHPEALPEKHALALPDTIKGFYTLALKRNMLRTVFHTTQKKNNKRNIYIKVTDRRFLHIWGGRPVQRRPYRKYRS